MRATIVVLTFNAEPWIHELLKSVEAQKADFEYEVLVIDSGSTDGTLDIIKDFPAVRLHQIPNSEFGHGKTRNLAARLAKGEFVVYLTHDTVPAHEHWLEEMLRPFELSDRVACVYGKQIPRGDCCPTVKRDVMSVFSGFGPDHFTMLQQKNPLITHPAAKDANTFFSDVNSAVRKSVLLGSIPYRDLNYSEDYAFGQDVIEAGLLKAYAPLGSVVHSHSYPLFKYFRRMYDEMLGMKKATGRTLDTGFLLHLAIITKATLGDWRFIVRDPAYSPLGKIKWLVQAPFYNIARRVAIHLATKPKLPAWAHSLLSLESSLKKDSQ